MDALGSAPFWVAIGEIVWINLLLSGDNAVVIALSARNLPRPRRNLAVLAGSAAAIVLRVTLTFFAVELLQLPYLKLAGALALLWIGVHLLAPTARHDASLQAPAQVWGAIRTIVLADLAMSADNVLAVAAAAQTGPAESRLLLLTIGLALSIPLIVFGSRLLLGLLERWPFVITFGAALLGFVAGDMLASELNAAAWFGGRDRLATTSIGLAGALAAVCIGRWRARRQLAAPGPRGSAPGSP